MPTRLPEHHRPTAAALRAVEGAVHDVFERAGYTEVLTPLVDRPEVFPLAGEDVVRLLDGSGEVLALRADHTGPVARLAGLRYRHHEGALRLSYRGPVFRGKEGLRERIEAGAELLGVPGAAGDAELVGLFLDALAAAGIAATAVIGSVAVVDALAPPTPAVRRALDRRDRTALLGLPEVQALSIRRRDALVQLLDWVGGPEVLDLAREASPQTDAVDELAQVLQDLAGRPVTVDLALVRTPTYYTGLVFDLYTPGAPRPVGGGGRYDTLAARFGPDRPAVGASLDLEVLAAVSSVPPC